MIDDLLEKFCYPYDYPDWRWKRARAFIADGVEPNRREDTHVRKAYAFMKDLRDTFGGELDNFRLSAKHKTVARAMEFHKNRGMKRQYMEALLLCGDCEIDEIAEWMTGGISGESLRMVKAYTKLFFDIRDHLDNPTFLCTRVLEPILTHEAFSGKDPRLAWKLGAIYGGKKVVKTFWEFGGTDDSVIELFKEAANTLMLRDLAFGTYFRPLNQYTLVQVSEYVQRAAEQQLRRSALDSGGGAESDLGVVINGLVNAVKFSLADQVEVEQIMHEDGREPRVHERVKERLELMQSVTP